jgi:hypothetical protein
MKARNGLSSRVRIKIRRRCLMRERFAQREPAVCRVRKRIERIEERARSLELAPERGRLALEKARPFKRGRDVNYWI